MDPDTTLAEIRRKLDDAHSADQFERIHKLIEALDGWISHGGFLPAAWNNSECGYLWGSVPHACAQPSRHDGEHRCSCGVTTATL